MAKELYQISPITPQGWNPVAFAAEAALRIYEHKLQERRAPDEHPPLMRVRELSADEAAHLTQELLKAAKIYGLDDDG